MDASNFRRHGLAQNHVEACHAGQEPVVQQMSMRLPILMRLLGIIEEGTDEQTRQNRKPPAPPCCSIHPCFCSGSGLVLRGYLHAIQIPEGGQGVHHLVGRSGNDAQSDHSLQLLAEGDQPAGRDPGREREIV